MHPQLLIAPLAEEYAKELCLWRYEPPYAIYNWPSWTEMLAGGTEFADETIRQSQYRAVLDEEGELVGFIQFFPMLGVTRLGLGLRPDLCGRGYGCSLAREAAQEALRRNPDNEIDLEVRIDNERAVRAYRKAGFTITDHYERMTPTGPADFYCMVFPSPASL
ncbi:GNAT family N-acetyltransferase [Gorillibacterium timonense]|uniref:GNAT family N-acetyltransferase n=1 Tax=Gorillibacterium timonense TaxID=1689269 RepID=UPI00071D1429|nr:GNAT family N-acetyltransferase [Gorillibacterium timonense]